MKITNVKDYSQDDSTQTVECISAVTEHNCIVMERKYTYMEDNDPTMEIKTGLEITLTVPNLSLEDQVYRSLEDLRREADGDYVVELLETSDENL